MEPTSTVALGDPVVDRMHGDFATLLDDETVGEALERLRLDPPPGRVIYFYVVDRAGRLRGVVPTRRLILSRPEALVAEIKIREALSLPASATILDACESFIRHRLLAVPVVGEDGRLVGVVDIDRCTEEMAQLDHATVVGRLVEPVVRFMRVESAGGLCLIAATVGALALAHSPLAGSVRAFWETSAGIRFGGFELIEPLSGWVNDGLMTFFFLVVGLEIKRELVDGELADRRKAILPAVAALGGMVGPAAIYTLGLQGRPGRAGWGVPMATDIAFVVGILTLLGPRVPKGLKVLLLSLAIVDDLGSVFVIAAVYSGPIAPGPVTSAGAGLAAILLLRWVGVRSALPYAGAGAFVWYSLLKSGVHPTSAGVLLGLLTPTRGRPGRGALLDVVGDLVDRLRGLRSGAPQASPEADSPADRLERALHPWVAFAIMPVFALANAGIRVRVDEVAAPVCLAVAAGLVVGKPLGIVLLSFAAVRVGLARLPDGVGWRTMLGAGCLGGIGFTMSLFMAGLALDGPLLGQAKAGVLAGSTISAILGCTLLAAALRRGPAG